MPKYYVYTVTKRRTGEVVVVGPVSRCAEVTGLAEDTLRDMALNRRDTYITPGRRMYSVTREQSDRLPPSNAKYYTVYSKKTDRILASGTSAECAKALGWVGPETLRRTMTREKRTGKTGYEFYSEPYYQDDEDDII